MTIKLLRLTATVLLLATVAFLFAGCGEEEQKAPTVAPKTTGTTKASGTGGTSTSKPELLVDQLIVPTDQTPKDFRKSLESRRPIVVTFYMTGTTAPADDNKVRSAISNLEGRYRGQVDFYDYLFSDAERFGDLTTLLKVNTTPTVVMINKQAKVQRAWTGYVDDKSLEQGISEIIK